MKMYCSYEIEDAVENSRKYDLETLSAMRDQMLKYENHLHEQYYFFAVELEGVAHAPMKAAMLSDQIREHEIAVRKMDAAISRLAA